MTFIDRHKGLVLAIISTVVLVIISAVSCGSTHAAQCNLAPPAAVVLCCLIGVAAGFVIEVMTVVVKDDVDAS